MRQLVHPDTFSSYFKTKVYQLQ